MGIAKGKGGSHTSKILTLKRRNEETNSGGWAVAVTGRSSSAGNHCHSVSAPLESGDTWGPAVIIVIGYLGSLEPGPLQWTQLLSFSRSEIHLPPHDYKH